MPMIQPPAFPTRLLKRLVPAHNHDALLGDLFEEYQTRRSPTWYCFQILAAVVVGTLKDIRTHSGLAVRAAVVGILSTLILITVTLALRDVATGAGFMWGTTWIGLPRYWHYPYYDSSSYRAFIELEWLLSAMASGWIVVRSHRRHGLTMAAAFLAALTTFRVWNISTMPGPVIGLTVSAFVRSNIVEGLLILVGGYLATERREQA